MRLQVKVTLPCGCDHSLKTPGEAVEAANPDGSKCLKG